MRKSKYTSKRGSGLKIDVNDDEEEYLSKGNLGQLSGRNTLEVDLDSLRIVAKASLKQNHYENAIFFANKLGNTWAPVQIKI